MIVGLHHVAISTPDLEAAVAFYSGLLGFEVVQRSGWDRDFPKADQAIGLSKTAAKMAMLQAGNAFVELWEYSNPTPEDRTARPCDLGYPHFALQVTDIDAEYARLSAGGMKFVGEVVDFGSSSAIYGRDPFGNVIELYEIRDESTAQLPSSRDESNR
ncbi:MAG: VOC family protein [Pseudomonadota bacterium]